MPDTSTGRWIILKAFCLLCISTFTFSGWTVGCLPLQNIKNTPFKCFLCVILRMVQYRCIVRPAEQLVESWGIISCMGTNIYIFEHTFVTILVFCVLQQEFLADYNSRWYTHNMSRVSQSQMDKYSFQVVVNMRSFPKAVMSFYVNSKGCYKSPSPSVHQHSDLSSPPRPITLPEAPRSGAVIKTTKAHSGSYKTLVNTCRRLHECLTLSTFAPRCSGSVKSFPTETYKLSERRR